MQPHLPLPDGKYWVCAGDAFWLHRRQDAMLRWQPFISMLADEETGIANPELPPIQPEPQPTFKMPQADGELWILKNDGFSHLGPMPAPAPFAPPAPTREEKLAADLAAIRTMPVAERVSPIPQSDGNIWRFDRHGFSYVRSTAKPPDAP